MPSFKAMFKELGSVDWAVGVSGLSAPLFRHTSVGVTTNYCVNSEITDFKVKSCQTLI